MLKLNLLKDCKNSFRDFTSADSDQSDKSSLVRVRLRRAAENSSSDDHVAMMTEEPGAPGEQGEFRKGHWWGNSPQLIYNFFNGIGFDNKIFIV